jgi:hypothetical protein
MAQFSGFAGTSGRVKAVAITPALTDDDVTFSGTPLTIAEFNKWTLTEQMDGEPPMILTFESPTNTEGTMFSELLDGGKGSFTVELSGVQKQVPTINFKLGQKIVLDLFAKKSASFGRQNVNVAITNIRQEQGVDQSVMTFSISCKGSGVPPAFGSITNSGA